MADKKLNESKIVKDMDYVLVTLADGSVGQIAKADLASVVAGIMGFGSALQYKGRIPNDTIGDFNNIGHGIWEAYALGSILNKPTDYMYGTLVCFKTNAFAVQVAFPLNNNSRIHYRVMDGVGTWYPWRSIQYV